MSEALPVRRLGDVEVGEQIARFVQPTSNLSSFLMGVAWWGAHRIHYDHRWARHDGFDDVVVMGSHMYAWVDRMLTGWAGDPGCLERLSFRQLAVAVVEEPLEVSAVVTEKQENGGDGTVTCAIEIAKRDGTKVLSGTGVVRLPR